MASDSPVSSPVIFFMVPSIPSTYTYLLALSLFSPHIYPYSKLNPFTGFHKKFTPTKHLVGLVAFLEIWKGMGPVLYYMPLVISPALSLLSSPLSLPRPNTTFTVFIQKVWLLWTVSTLIDTVISITYLPCPNFEPHWTPAHHGSTQIPCSWVLQSSYENGAPSNTDTHIAPISAHRCSLVPLDFTSKTQVPRKVVKSFKIATGGH